MTKRDLIKMLVRKQNEALAMAEYEYCAAFRKEKQDLCCGLGFEKVADEIQDLFERAQIIWDEFKAKCEAVETASFRFVYSTPINQLHEFVGEKGTTFHCLLNSAIRVQTESMLKAREVYRTLNENIKQTYQNVITTTMSMKTEQEVVEYLTTLGFDLSELEPKPDPGLEPELVAELPKIDTSYLFLKKAT